MIVNLRNGFNLANHPRWALKFHQRLFGMMLRHFRPGQFDALIFPDCAAIHCCFMLIKLDVVFLNNANQVTAIRRNLPPWAFACAPRGTCITVELPAGAAGTERDLKIGDTVNLNSTLTPEGIEKLRSGCMLLEPSLPAGGAIQYQESER